MFCKNCGKQIPDDAAFCPNCGAATNVVPPPSVSANANTSSGEVGQKSALAAGLLGIFLGCFGVHNFYLGYTSKAVVQLILGILVVALPISAIWGLIEGIMILTGEISLDGYGKKIKRDL